MPGPQATSNKAPYTELGRDGLVQVDDYHCSLDKGAPVAQEQFSAPTISIVRSGVFGFRSDHDNQLLTTGFVLLANPGQRYEISHDHGGGDRCLVFRFDPIALDEISGRDSRSTTAPLFARSVLPPIPRIDALRHLAEQRISTGGPALGLEELGLALASCALEHTGRARAVAATQQGTRAGDTIYAALEHLDRVANDEVRLGDIADAVGLSPFHFLRLFKRETGVTPYRFVMQARIRNAVELLRDTTLPVTEIAFAVGFGDLSNFINFFRREIGCSPSQFRKAEPSDWAAALLAKSPVGARKSSVRSSR